LVCREIYSDISSAAPCSACGTSGIVGSTQLALIKPRGALLCPELKPFVREFFFGWFLFEEYEYLGYAGFREQQ